MSKQKISKDKIDTPADERSPKRRPSTIDGNARNNPMCKPEQKRIEQQKRKPKRDKKRWQRQKDQQLKK